MAEPSALSMLVVAHTDRTASMYIQDNEHTQAGLSLQLGPGFNFMNDMTHCYLSSSTMSTG